jgi:membrane-bound lytic murein transglycosylase B
MSCLRQPLLIAGVLLSATVSAAEPASYRAGADAFIGDMVARHGFDAAEVTAVLADARYSQAIVDAMDRPYEAKPWHRYRALFVTPERIRGGVDFWNAQADLLARAESVYGVSPQVIVAIIGVETNYGGHLGTHRVLDALTTLGFSYPRRAAFFRDQLEAYLVLGREEEIDVVAAVGSYAGAMGKPQFIPSSYRAYAVDFDADGRRDLWRSDADVIGSVANYLASHGWRRGEAVALSTTLPDGVPDGMPPGLEVAEKTPVAPAITARELRAVGVAVPESLAPTTPMTLIRLDGETDEYWLGLTNLYAITRYNQSNLYAMAVYQLSEAIRAARRSATLESPR